MGSSLAPLLAHIFMIELERLLVPNLSKIKLWGRYIDDSICFAKFGPIEYIISVLNSSHRKIKFTYEVGGNAKLAFLDVLLMRNDEDITTAVYRKESISDAYLG